MSHPEAFEALQKGDFPAAVSLLEKAASETNFSSDLINHAYTVALYRAGELKRLADVAFRIGSDAAANDPGLALDYFQRALVAGFDAERSRQIAACHEQWAGSPASPPRTSGKIGKVAHVVGGLSVAGDSTRHVRMLCEGLSAYGVTSSIFSTEWADSWFFNSSGAGHAEDVESHADVWADVWRAPLEGDLLSRAHAVAQAVGACAPDVIFFHSSFFEQIAARAAAFRVGPPQVHVNHDVEIDANLFAARIHCSARGLAGTRYPEQSASWIPMASDVETRLAKETPISRRSIGLDNATSISATFGDLDRICSPAYIAALTEILVRLPNHCHLFAGPGHVRTLRQTLHAEGVLPRVRFLGAMGDTASLLGALDFYLAPFPHLEREFILDAMGAGKPVVIHRKAMDSGGNSGSDLVGAEDLIVDSQTGYVEAASRLIRKAELRQSMSALLRERFSAEFTPKAMAKRYLDLAETLLTTR